MNITIRWGGGGICVDTEAMIKEIPLTNYRKWLKLLIRYGNTEDHINLINCLCDSLIACHRDIKTAENTVSALTGCPGRSFSAKKREANKKLSTLRRQRLRILKMWDLLGVRLK